MKINELAKAYEAMADVLETRREDETIDNYIPCPSEFAVAGTLRMVAKDIRKAMRGEKNENSD